MPIRRMSPLCCALIAAMLALPLLPVRALAVGPLESQANSFQSAIDNFISHLKSETNEAARTAARIARDNQDVLDAARSRMDSHLSDFRAALSGRKEDLKTLHEDASAMWKAWKKTAVSSWDSVERHANEVLDWIAKWRRNQSLSVQRPEIPV
jgi:ElaB/YqjD/DUF883 family membrane-anchored ribosome-binding protein